MLGSFLFTGDDAHKPARVLSGGEKTRLALAILVVSSANVLLLDEPTNNLDPASREEVLAAIRTYEGAIVLVTHDEGAVHALEPDRVLLLPGRRRGPLERRLRRPGVAGLTRAGPRARPADQRSTWIPRSSRTPACCYDVTGRGRDGHAGPSRGAQRADARRCGARWPRSATQLPDDVRVVVVRGSGHGVLRRARPGDARPGRRRRGRRDGRRAAGAVRRGGVGGDRRVPARLHLAARPALRVDRRRAGLRHRRRASSSRCPATCGSSPTTPSSA